jgi:hypothetical protein
VQIQNGGQKECTNRLQSTSSHVVGVIV